MKFYDKKHNVFEKKYQAEISNLMDTVKSMVSKLKKEKQPEVCESNSVDKHTDDIKEFDDKLAEIEKNNEKLRERLEDVKNRVIDKLQDEEETEDTEEVKETVNDSVPEEVKEDKSEIDSVEETKEKEKSDITIEQVDNKIIAKDKDGNEIIKTDIDERLIQPTSTI